MYVYIRIQIRSRCVVRNTCRWARGLGIAIQVVETKQSTSLESYMLHGLVDSPWHSPCVFIDQLQTRKQPLRVLGTFSMTSEVSPMASAIEHRCASPRNSSSARDNFEENTSLRPRCVRCQTRPTSSHHVHTAL